MAFFTASTDYAISHTQTSPVLGVSIKIGGLEGWFVSGSGSNSLERMTRPSTADGFTGKGLVANGAGTVTYSSTFQQGIDGYLYVVPNSSGTIYQLSSTDGSLVASQAHGMTITGTTGQIGLNIQTNDGYIYYWDGTSFKRYKWGTTTIETLCTPATAMQAEATQFVVVDNRIIYLAGTNNIIAIDFVGNVIESILAKEAWSSHSGLAGYEQSGEYYIGYADYSLNKTFGYKLTINQPPNAPTSLTPSGTSTTPALITPTNRLAWTFSDPDANDTQSAYQVIIKNPDGTVKYDSTKVVSINQYCDIPSTVALVRGTTYTWTVRTWDNKDTVGSYASDVYVKVNSLPTATSLTPSGTSTTPAPVGSTPRLSWTYGDADAQAQAHLQVLIKNSDGTIKYDSTQLASANAYFDVPSTAGLTGGSTYIWTVRVNDGMEVSDYGTEQYIKVDSTPIAPTLSSPVDTYRTGVRPVFEATIGDDEENDGQHFVIQIAEDSAFSVGLQERKTETALAGWEAKTSTGSFVAMPTGGVDSTYEGGTTKYTWQTDLIEGTMYYWRVAGIDVSTGARGDWSASRTIRVGNVFQLQTESVQTQGQPKNAIVRINTNIAQDGTTPASFKVEVCNNALDATPTWEDCTIEYLSGVAYKFANTTKTATDWAIAVRVTLTANDTLGAVEIKKIGLFFE
jgi:hypothetical protein